MHVTCACVQHKCVCVCGVRGVCVLSRNWSIHHAHELPFRHRTRSDRAVAPQLHQLFANAAADDVVALCVPRPQQHDQYADERDARTDVVAGTEAHAVDSRAPRERQDYEEAAIRGVYARERVLPNDGLRRGGKREG